MQPDDSVFLRNETLRTINDRHSVRTFTRDDVTDEEISILLRAANAAPSAHNQQAWQFIILRGEKKQDLAQLVTAQSAAFSAAGRGTPPDGSEEHPLGAGGHRRGEHGGPHQTRDRALQGGKGDRARFLPDHGDPELGRCGREPPARRHLPRPRHGLARRALSHQGLPSFASSANPAASLWPWSRLAVPPESAAVRRNSRLR